MTSFLELFVSVDDFCQKFLPFWEAKLLKTEAKSVVDQLKNISQIEHTRHRSLTNCFINIIAGLIAYYHQPTKPSLNLFPSDLLSA